MFAYSEIENYSIYSLCLQAVSILLLDRQWFPGISREYLIVLRGAIKQAFKITIDPL